MPTMSPTSRSGSDSPDTRREIARASGSDRRWSFSPRRAEGRERERGRGARRRSCARFPLQGLKNEDDARDTYKTLKDCHIGQANAAFYCEWAMVGSRSLSLCSLADLDWISGACPLTLLPPCIPQFEHRCGNQDKALEIVSKGLRNGARPAHEMERLRERLEAEEPPRPARSRAAAAASGPGVGHLMTPAVDRRSLAASADPFATPATISRRPLGLHLGVTPGPALPTRPGLGLGTDRKQAEGGQTVVSSGSSGSSGQSGGSGDGATQYNRPEAAVAAGEEDGTYEFHRYVLWCSMLELPVGQASADRRLDPALPCHAGSRCARAPRRGCTATQKPGPRCPPPRARRPRTLQ